MPLEPATEPENKSEDGQRIGTKSKEPHPANSQNQPQQKCRNQPHPQHDGPVQQSQASPMFLPETPFQWSARLAVKPTIPVVCKCARHTSAARSRQPSPKGCST